MLDLLPALHEASASPERLYYPDDKHWTAAGHAVAAREIERFLAERGMIP
jgi:hypothetical protein